ncbi:MAG: hypothetical protein Q9182_004788 [Xanthomendoza sp. 2 TL-2023]
MGYAGTPGMTWGWLIAMIFIQCVAMSMAELCSAMPTSGGLYYAAAVLAPPGWGPLAAWITGWSNWLVQITGAPSVDYGMSAMILAAASIRDPTFVPQHYQVFLLTVFIMLIQSCVSSMPTNGYDAPFHLSEECSNANIASPRAIVLTSGVGGLFGWFLQLVVAYTVVDIDAALNSEVGSPYAAYLLQVLPQTATLAILALTIVCAFSMGQGCMVAASRVTFAYSRDDCFGSLSAITKRVNRHTLTPVNAVWFNTIVGIVMTVLIFGGDLAAGALFSIGAVAAFVAFTIPIFIRVFLGPKVNIEHQMLGRPQAAMDGLEQASSGSSSREDQGADIDKAARRGRRFLAVDAAHKHYGALVRIQPDHVSIADPDAIPVIYSHTGGWTKSNYYDAFVSIRRGLFNTRDRAEHTRKRKAISHTFSAKSISHFEQYIRSNLKELVTQWNKLADTAAQSGEEYADMDCLPWFNYAAFDIIGDLVRYRLPNGWGAHQLRAFGAPFGMLSRGKDIAEVRPTPNSPATYAPAIEVLNRRSEVSNTLGCYPALTPFAKYLPDPFFGNGAKAVENLAGMAFARVNQRLEAKEKGVSQRNDLLERLMEGKDENGEALGREELAAEAQTQLIAGSDTTSNTSCALLYWCLKTKGVMEKLQREIAEAVPDDTDVPSFDAVKDLP